LTTRRVPVLVLVLVLVEEGFSLSPPLPDVLPEYEAAGDEMAVAAAILGVRAPSNFRKQRG